MVMVFHVAKSWMSNWKKSSAKHRILVKNPFLKLFCCTSRCSGDNSPSGGFSFVNLAENLETNSCFAVAHFAATRLYSNATSAVTLLLRTSGFAATRLIAATLLPSRHLLYCTQCSIHGNATPGCFAAAQTLWLMRLQPLSSACEVGLGLGEVVFEVIARGHMRTTASVIGDVQRAH